MNKRVIEINGVSYPLRATMGALVRFRNMTGKEVKDMDSENITELCSYFYCLIKSACNADKVDFTLSFDDFCDLLTPEVFNEISAKIAVEENEKN